MDVDLDAINNIKTLENVYDCKNEVVRVDTGTWDSLGEIHFATFPYNAQDKLHGVSKTYVDNVLFQEKLYVNGKPTSFAYYNSQGEIVSISLWDPVNGTSHKFSKKTF